MTRRLFDEAVAPLSKAVELKPDYAPAQERLQEARRALGGRQPKTD
jgi:hypothetical protein